ncbi:LamG-like jellyroll fold domain-containing protein [Lacinutrix cladophorae]
MKKTTLLRSRRALLFAAFLVLNISFAQVNVAPGNTPENLQLWMKGNTGTSATANGQQVENWIDNSSNTFTATKGGSNAPIYVHEAINFNPALRFDRENKRYYKIPTASVSGTGLDITPSPASPTVSKRSDMTIFAAFLTDGSGAGTMLSRASNDSRSYQLWLGDRDRVVHYTLGRTEGTSQSDPNSGINYGITHARNDPKISSVTIDINTDLSNDPNTNKILRYVNGYLDPLTTHTDGDAGFGTGETTNMDVLIGARRNSNNNDSENELTGDLAEIIVYNRALNATERQKVETYLAIKYGITLGYNDEYYRYENTPNQITNFGYSGTSNNYLLSNSSIAWSGNENAGFGYNVFGIARDDGSALLQLKSKSVHVEEITKNTSIITVEDESGSISNDKDYLLIGNNGATVQLQASSVPERVTSTINRIWKARESNNDVGTVKLDFDLSQFNISEAANLELIVSNNSNLTNYKNYSGSYNNTSKTVTFTGVNLKDAEYFTLAKLQEIQASQHLSFNGTSQFIDLENNLDLGNTFTISTWVNRQTSATSMSILSKRDARFSNGGYDLHITANGKINMSWKNTLTTNITSNTTIPVGKWHHVAIIYSGNLLKIYIDGIEDKTSSTIANPINNTYEAVIGASNKKNPIQYYKGSLDELRVWNIALSENQLRYIMNQEIRSNGAMVSGVIIPSTISKNEVETLSWANLKAYYPFSYVRGNCVFNKSSNTTQNGRLYNTLTAAINTQTAPLPYRSTGNGNWNTENTWLNGNTQNIPGTTSIVDNTKTVDWNIIVTNHNIPMDNANLPNENRVLLGLLVNSNKLTLNGDNLTKTGNGLTISHYLNLDGEIDLQGESQLIQTNGSDLDINSAGFIEKDQQGTQDYFTYNYWSSPVGVRNSTSNNNSYTLNDNIFKDGSDPNTPVNMNFVSGYNGNNGNPISIANYWIWKFSNRTSQDYASWQHIRNTGTLFSGEGFTMKGVTNTNNNVSLEQNYVFEGKPNNGEITLPINAGNDYLVGNPYASAIDAEKFILDNGPSIAGNGNTTGTLYFWEHWGGGSHNLADYQGGYATYNLAGGTPCASLGTNDPDLATGGTLTKIPGQYIPVAQGFFVTGEANGTLKFNNGQRVFQKENTSTSVFVRTDQANSSPTANADNGDDRVKIRLGFNSVNTLHRQLLLTQDERATSNYDWGFDAKNINLQIDDMYWIIEGEKCTIQGIDQITETTIIPIGIHLRDAGLNTITIDALVNFPEDLQIYLHDKTLGIYHNLKTSNYEIELPAGLHLERFEITFTNPSLSINDVEMQNLEVYFSNNTKNIIINNPKNLQIENTSMINLLGQKIYSFKNTTNKNYIEYKIQKLSTGTYIINLETEIGQISKKVIVK